eukprot:4307179-Pyramimonas_sp.AAC.1
MSPLALQPCCALARALPRLTHPLRAPDRDLGGDNKGTPPVCAGSRSVLTINPPKRTQRCPYLRALPSLASTECGQCDQMCVNLW